MLYRLLADGTMVVHYAFVAYVVAGGFLAWRRPRTIWVHIAAVAWGFGGILIGYDCPLTALESWARERGGGRPLPDSGFIAHYLTGVIYPESALTLVQAGVAALVLTSWAGVVLRRRVRPIAAA
ncbi:DUF2784 domain-containing protein [Nocardia sp. NPDC050697]|uniref:DUF2784 domain-containing protein n=1 Tax=Nocardia sp. NPDC050697 TaxID=3155158 RepID=UPI0033C3152B